MTTEELNAAMRTAVSSNDNEAWYSALREWIARDPQKRSTKKLSELSAGEWSEILLIAQDYKLTTR